MGYIALEEINDDEEVAEEGEGIEEDGNAPVPLEPEVAHGNCCEGEEEQEGDWPEEV
jgi:hypothetical protein